MTKTFDFGLTQPLYAVPSPATVELIIRHLNPGDEAYSLEELLALAKNQDIKSLSVSVGDQDKGYLVPQDGGFTILLYGEPDFDRRGHRKPMATRHYLCTHPGAQFVLAHEIAHTLFYERSDRFPSLTWHPFGEQAQAQEVFCDTFAATLLKLDLATAQTFGQFLGSPSNPKPIEP
jgi:hypothetical protein